MTLKKSLKAIIALVILFFIILLSKGDVKFAAIFCLFLAATVIFISNVISIYLHLRNNRFRIASLTYVKNWRYFAISTIIVILVYVFILPESFILVGGIPTLCLLVGLFIFDIVKSILKF
jgi:hypothetical protein